MSETREFDLEAVLSDPSIAFQRPLQISNAEGMTRNDKIIALERWAEMLKEQLDATSEGMPAPPGVSTKQVGMLDEIAKALAIVQQQPPNTGL